MGAASSSVSSSPTSARAPGDGPPTPSVTLACEPALREGLLCITWFATTAGPRIAAGTGGDKRSEVIAWDAVTLRALHRLDFHAGGASCLRASADGAFLLASAPRGVSSRLWRVADGSLAGELPGPAECCDFAH